MKVNMFFGFYSIPTLYGFTFYGNRFDLLKGVCPGYKIIVCILADLLTYVPSYLHTQLQPCFT